ncbi:hypothetical protein B0G84_8816, partial [Paraburkholderia sp. BL8N3]
MSIDERSTHGYRALYPPVALKNIVFQIGKLDRSRFDDLDRRSERYVFL